jgi:hypothetical protein
MAPDNQESTDQSHGASRTWNVGHSVTVSDGIRTDDRTAATDRGGRIVGMTAAAPCEAERKLNRWRWRGG